MGKKYVLMPIKPIYAAKIKSGEKTVELRRTAPKVTSNDALIVYESSPVKAVTAYCKIKEIVNMPLEQLWEYCKDDAAVTKDYFDKYFHGKTNGYGIILTNVQVLEAPILLKAIGDSLVAPQSYRYITEEAFYYITDGNR